MQEMHEFLRREFILCRTKFTAYLLVLLLCHYLAQNIRPQGHERLAHPFARALTGPERGHVTEHAYGQAAERVLEHFLRRIAVAHHGGHCWYHCQCTLNMRDEVFGQGGVKLHQETSCGCDHLVCTHKHTKGDGTGNLL